VRVEEAIATLITGTNGRLRGKAPPSPIDIPSALDQARRTPPGTPLRSPTPANNPISPIHPYPSPIHSPIQRTPLGGTFQAMRTPSSPVSAIPNKIDSWYAFSLHDHETAASRRQVIASLSETSRRMQLDTGSKKCSATEYFDGLM
jgi:hypothetical protein